MQIHRRDAARFRWWRAEEIVAASDLFASRRVGELLGELLRGGVPAVPVELGS